MEINASTVKELRERTGAGMMDCKRALVEVKGSIEEAVEYLRIKGLSAAGKKAGRDTKEGVIGSYVHSNGKVAVLVEVNCETDFVARNETFQTFVKDLSMHIAAAAPVCVNGADMPAEFIAKERAISLAQMKEDPKMAGKAQAMLDKIIDGKMNKLAEEHALMNQKFVKNPDLTIAQLVSQTVSVIGENVSIARFTRYVLGETAAKPAEAEGAN
ncbi:MAG: translation elongation factor Ts [Proteobacteria bacterium]|nr:MAG: translation elongation factor Ts [Pseudomonadota bacterium]